MGTRLCKDIVSTKRRAHGRVENAKNEVILLRMNNCTWDKII